MRDTPSGCGGKFTQPSLHLLAEYCIRGGRARDAICRERFFLLNGQNGGGGGRGSNAESKAEANLATWSVHSVCAIEFGTAIRGQERERLLLCCNGGRRGGRGRYVCWPTRKRRFRLFSPLAQKLPREREIDKSQDEEFTPEKDPVY